MVRMVDRNVQGRETAEGSATAVVSPSGEPIPATTEELLAEILRCQRAIVLGLSILTETDLWAEDEEDLEAHDL